MSYLGDNLIFIIRAAAERCEQQIRRMGRMSKIAACVLTAICLFGCSDPKLAAIPASGTILAFGDSLTVGVGASNSQSYPSVLEELSGRRVINSGVSGETTAGGLQRLRGVLAKTQPDLMILLEGGNDVLRNQPFASIKNNLAGMITLASQQGVPVVLIGVPEKNLFSSSAPFYEELADEHEVVFDGALLGSLLRTVSYKSDPIHLNEKGYRAMAEDIHDLLVDNGAL